MSPPPPEVEGAALVVVDVQRGFDDADFWGARDNLACETNIAALLRHWRERAWPLVYVQHASSDPASPLHPSRPGHALKPFVTGEPALWVRKSVNSSFHGSPDLHEWLQASAISRVVVCGITTNHCCETTARIAGNLGYETFFVVDATHTFDRDTPDGVRVPAATLSSMTATNLHGEFATVVSTAAITGS